MRLWCYIFGHKPKKPRKSRGESGLYTTCKNCDVFFIRGYFKGWQRATPTQKAYYLRMYGPDAPVLHDPKDDGSNGDGLKDSRPNDDQPESPGEDVRGEEPVRDAAPEEVVVPQTVVQPPVTPPRRRRRRSV